MSNDHLSEEKRTLQDLQSSMHAFSSESISEFLISGSGSLTESRATNKLSISRMCRFCDWLLCQLLRPTDHNDYVIVSSFCEAGNQV